MAASLVERPRLEALLDGVFGKRLTTVVAGAGYGKTTLLAQWSSDVECAWYTISPSPQLSSLVAGLANALGPRVHGLPTDAGTRLTAPDDSLRATALAAHVATELERSLEHDFVLVLDDAHELGDSPSAQLAEGLVRQAPPLLHVVLASRAQPQFRIQRLRGQGQVLELDAAELAFTAEEIGELLELSFDGDARALAPRVYDLTQGWPAAVRLAVGALERVDARHREDVLERLRMPEGPLLNYLAEEVFEGQSSAVRELVRSLAPFERFTVGLCDALGLADSREAIESLRRQGLFLTEHGSDFLSLHALVREYAQERLPLQDHELRALNRRAAAWFEEQDLLEEALRSHVASEDEKCLAHFLGARGEDLLAHGSIDPVLRAGDSLPVDARDAHVEEIVGEAHSLTGDWDGALACYQRAAGDEETLAPGLAWRMGRLYWDRGLFEEANAEYARGRVDGSSPLEEAFLLAWMSMAVWNLGNVKEAQELAERSRAAAELTGSERATAAAHNALGCAYLGHDPARAERHLATAQAEAESAGDILQIIRIAVNRAAGPAEPQDAIAMLEMPMRLAELAGAGLYVAAVLNTRAEAYRALGRFDDSLADHRRALSLFDAYGSARRNWSVLNFGLIAFERGDLAYARSVIQEALDTTGDVQGLIDAQRWLAQLLAFDDPEEARHLAEEALAETRQLGHKLAGVLATAGWIALARGDKPAALALAHEALGESHRQRLRLDYASALELKAMASPDPAQERSLLEEATEIWRDAGSEVDLARNRLAVARLTRDRAASEKAWRTLRAAGIREQAAGAAGLLACLPPEEPEPVRIRTLGSFTVLREGQPVPLGEWRSRKARDLLKILVARRGRAAPREYLIEALWPNEDPTRLGNRLSNALSVLRTVLDPEKQFDAEHFVSGRKTGVLLRLDAVPVDVEEFLADADTGLEQFRDDRADEARDRLIAAEAVYAGDFLEEDAYEEWAVPMREEARVAYIAVAHALAQIASTRNELDDAPRYLLRVLERDPYDERAHLELVKTLARAGHHGEARRCYAAYAGRMDEIGVEAAPYPPSATAPTPV